MKYVDLAERLVRSIGLYAALILLPLLIFGRVYEILTRALNTPGSLFNAMESELFLLFAFLIVGSAYVSNSHVRVDILDSRLSEKARAVIDLLGTLFFVLPFAAIVIWYGLTMVELAYQAGERSAVSFGAPLRWINVSAIPIGIGLFTIAAICRTLRCLNNLKTGSPS